MNLHLINTYAGSGIGRDASIAYALEGARALVLADINRAALEETARKCEDATSRRGLDPLIIHILDVDVSDEESVTKMIFDTVSKVGRIDYCVNTAGVSYLLVFTTLFLFLFSFISVFIHKKYRAY